MIYLFSSEEKMQCEVFSNMRTHEDLCVGRHKNAQFQQYCCRCQGVLPNRALFNVIGMYYVIDESQQQ